MVKWFLLLLAVVLCALAGGILLGPQLTPLVNGATTPETVSPPTPPPILRPTCSEERLRLIVVLVNDLDLGSKSHLELAWVSTMIHAGGSVQLALKPLPADLVVQTAHLPWIQDNGVLNPEVVAQVFNEEVAHNFCFFVLDLHALSDLFGATGPLALPEGGQCQAEECISWAFQPDDDPTGYQTRLHFLIAQSLKWIADQPGERVSLVTAWLLRAMAQDRVHTDIPPDVWSQWAAKAKQGGFQPVP